jgi:uncharacterized membrane protein YtjA (UPF0391 family)
MTGWLIACIVGALATGVFGFARVAAGMAKLARVLFFVFVLVALALGLSGWFLARRFASRGKAESTLNLCEEKLGTPSSRVLGTGPRGAGTSELGPPAPRERRSVDPGTGLRS